VNLKSKRAALLAAPIALGLAACAPMTPPPAPTQLPPVNSLTANGDSFQSAVSDNGQFVVFASDATNLVAGDTNGATDIFLRDRMANTLVLVSQGIGNVPANGGSSNPSISDDGAKIVFESDATNLTAGDTNGVGDVFSKVGLVTTNLTGAGNSASTDASISGNGNTVVLQTFASNLTVGDTNATADIVTVPTAGGPATAVSSTLPNDYSEFPSISDDGTKVAFGTFATNIGGDATNSAIVIATGGTVSPATATVANGYVRKPAISGDGTKVAFESNATNLFAGDTNASRDIVIATGGVTAAATVTLGNGDAADPTLSDTGSVVAFTSTSSNLAYEGNGVGDVFTATGGTASLATGNVSANGETGEAALSGTGGFVSFTSAATNLAAGDANGKGDVFVRDLSA